MSTHIFEISCFLMTFMSLHACVCVCVCVCTLYLHDDTECLYHQLLLGSASIRDIKWLPDKRALRPQCVCNRKDYYCPSYTSVPGSDQKTYAQTATFNGAQTWCCIMLAIPRSWFWFPGNACFSLNAMYCKSLWIKTICQMHRCKCLILNCNSYITIF